MEEQIKISNFLCAHALNWCLFVEYLEENKVRYENLVYNGIRWLDFLDLLSTKTKDLEVNDSKIPIVLGAPVSLRLDFLTDVTKT